MFPLFFAHWKMQLNVLWLGQVMLMAVLSMSLPYWPLYVSELGEFNPNEIRFWSAAIYIAPFASSIISSPLWGKLGDRYGYKPMVIRACLGLFVTQTLIVFSSDVFWIFIFRFLQGILAGFIVAAQTWAMSICPKSERGATMGKLQSATAVGSLCGPLLGGLIATYGGYHSIFSVSSFICCVVTIAFIFLLNNTTHPESDSSAELPMRPFSEFKQKVILLLLIISLIHIGRSMITPVFSMFITEQLGGNDLTVGWLFAATGLMIFLTASSWGRLFDRLLAHGYSIHTVILCLFIAAFGIQIIQVYASTVFSVLMCRIVWGMCLGGLLTIFPRLLIDYSRERENGFFLGLGNSAIKIGNLVGMLLGALIEAHLGYASSLFATACMYAMACFVFLKL